MAIADRRAPLRSGRPSTLPEPSGHCEVLSAPKPERDYDEQLSENGGHAHRPRLRHAARGCPYCERQNLSPGDGCRRSCWSWPAGTAFHPVHLHRHSFEVTKVGDTPAAGVMKDTVNMTRFSTVEIDFVADDPGPSLLHCHHQDHQDEGFMGMMTYL
jgi:Multicopper oxidase